MDVVSKADEDVIVESDSDRLRSVEQFLTKDVPEALAQKAILEGVSAVSMDGLPKGSRKTEDGTQMHCEELCEELRAVSVVIEAMTGRARAVCSGLLSGKLDREIYEELGYSKSHYYHTVKRQALLRFADMYPLKEF